MATTHTFGGHTYTNGNVPAAVLAPLRDQPNAFLRRDAAAAWNRATAEVLEKTGLLLVVRGWNRSYAEQVRFFLERYRVQWIGSGPFGDVRWWNGKRYVRFTGASAAIPGRSNHGWGLAVDVVDFGGVGQFSHWRREKAFPILARHGFTDTEGRQSHVNEPWHLVYAPTADLVAKTIGAGGNVTTPTVPGAPAPITPREGFLMALSEDQQQEIYDLLTGKVDDPAYPKKPIRWVGALGRMLTILRRVDAAVKRIDEYKTTDPALGQEISYRTAIARTLHIARRAEAERAGLIAAIENLAAGQGADPAVVSAAAQAGAERAIAKAKLTNTTTFEIGE